MTLHALPDPPDLDDDDLIPPEVPDAVAELAAAYGCSVADMIRWLVDEDDLPEGFELSDAYGPLTAPLMRWRIESADQAEWALSKLDSARAALQDVAGQADRFREPLKAKLARVDEWERSAARSALSSARYFEGQLDRWARLQRELTGVKSQQLPSGLIETRATPEHVVVQDHEAVAAAVDAWRLDVDVKVTRRVDARQLKATARPVWEHFAELECGHTVELGVDIILPPIDGPGVECGQCAESAAALGRPLPVRPIRHLISSRVPVIAAEGRWHTLDGAAVVPERIGVTARTDHVEPVRFTDL